MGKKYFEDFPVIVDLKVAWGEMDAFRHVNNIIYFRYFESARIVYLDEIDFSDRDKSGGIGPILGHTQCKYIRPLTFPDSICVGARTTEIKDDRFSMELKIFSHRHEAVAALGTAEIVAFDYEKNKKVLIPSRIRQNIKILERQTF